MIDRPVRRFASASWIATFALVSAHTAAVQTGPPAAPRPEPAHATNGSAVSRPEPTGGSGGRHVVWPAAFARLNYSPIEKPEHAGNSRRDVKGLYVTRYSAGSARLDELIEIADQTSINAFVIDVKDDRGDLLFRTEAAAKYNPEANRKALREDPRPLLQRLKAKNIYCIARIVTFKDPSFASAHPQKAILNDRTGKPFQSTDGMTWASPYDSDFREYNLDVAREAAAAGFQEIQFDYIRFPDVARTARLNYRNSGGQSKAQTVQSFLLEARRRLSPLKVYIAADVFGLVCTTVDDMDIGQYWEAMSNAVDYICPMMYPSHYANRSYGLRVPDRQPYELIDRGIHDALGRNHNLATPARLRPWIQGFTATWIKEYRDYGVAEVKAQIKALADNGVTSFLVWNPSNRYLKEAYR
jgi:hypothetical protein